LYGSLSSGSATICPRRNAAFLSEAVMATNRRIIGAIGIGGILCASVLLAADWPQWRGANRDATVTQFTPPATWPKELAKKWSVSVGTGDATPALVGDKLYTFTREGDDEVITALAAADGKQIWQQKYPSPPVTGAANRHPGPRSSPAVAQGKVVTLGVAEILSCLDADKGTVAWRKDFKGEFPKTNPQFYTATSPIIVDGLCITHLGGQGKGAMMAFVLSTGDVKWKWDGDAPAYSSPVVMTVDGVKMVVEETEKMVVGVSVADGKLLWQLPFAGQGMRAYNAPTPIIDGTTVIYVGSGRGIRAAKIEKQADAFAATELWSNKEVATQFNTPVLDGGMLFGISDSNHFFCLSEKDGKTLWTDNANRQSQGFGSMVAAGPVVFALTPKAELIAFVASDKGYSELAKYKVSETETYAYPVISGKNIFIKDKESVTMYAME
jgi:outer membrane protein assembly factor BamB